MLCSKLHHTDARGVRTSVPTYVPRLLSWLSNPCRACGRIRFLHHEPLKSKTRQEATRRNRRRNDLRPKGEVAFSLHLKPPAIAATPPEAAAAKRPAFVEPWQELLRSVTGGALARLLLLLTRRRRSSSLHPFKMAIPKRKIRSSTLSSLTPLSHSSLLRGPCKKVSPTESGWRITERTQMPWSYSWAGGR